VTPEDIARDILRRRRSDHLLLLSDFDGTLCDFNVDPDEVYLSDARRELLARVGGRSCCTVGIVSGRRLADLRARVGHIGGIYLAGFHGLEIDGGDEYFVHPDAASAAEALREVAAAAAAAVRRLPGVFIEDKGLSIALHYRAADPAHRVVAQSVFIDTARSGLDAGRFRLLPGSCVVELLPNTRWNKGDAVRWIVQHVAARTSTVFPVYIGDDITDADALVAVHPHGVGIAASTRVTAEYDVDGAPAVERLLRALDAELHC
jgi:alpha,alpha-trehalase